MKKRVHRLGACSIIERIFFLFPATHTLKYKPTRMSFGNFNVTISFKNTQLDPPSFRRSLSLSTSFSWLVGCSDSAGVVSAFVLPRPIRVLSHTLWTRNWVSFLLSCALACFLSAFSGKKKGNWPKFFLNFSPTFHHPA